ncbi:MAG: cohesin domain-containing protein [Clostridia bacterium]|nr:cohesin domain-containing protein [Clostridia bacterium]
MSKSPIIKSIFQVTFIAMLVLTLLISCVLVAEGASAESLGTAEGTSAVGFLETPQIQALPGSIIEIPVSIINNPGLISCQFFLNFDPAWFTPTKIVRGNALGGGIFVANLHNLAESGMFWFDLHQNSLSFDGEIFKLGLKIAPNTPPGIYPLTLSYAAENTLNSRLEKVSFGQVVNGNLEVIANQACLVF